MHSERYPRLEVLAIAIASANEAFTNPSSKAFKLRNPGLLRSFALFHQQTTDDDGYRIFKNFFNGHRALMDDLEIKCTGKTRSSVLRSSGKHEKITSDSNLKDLMDTLRLRHDSAILTCDNCGRETTIEGFLKSCFGGSFSALSKIGFFLENE